MGISTYQSYCGAQIFDAVGLSTTFVDGTSPAPRRSRGHRLDEVASETVMRHADAFGDDPITAQLDVGGEYAFRSAARPCLEPRTSVAMLQHAVRGQLARIQRSPRDERPDRASC